MPESIRKAKHANPIPNIAGEKTINTSASTESTHAGSIGQDFGLCPRRLSITLRMVLCPASHKE
jgi:hypothetical protein